MSNDEILKYKKLTARLLEIAGDQFSDHGCNNFDLESVLPDVVDRCRLAKLMAQHNEEPEEYDPQDDYKNVQDDSLMMFFSSIFEG